MCSSLHRVSYVHMDFRETGWGNEVIVSCYMRLENSEPQPPQLLNEIKNVCYGGCETDLN